MNTQFLIQLLVNGLGVGTLYGVVAMSFVLIYKATQVVNFAQGELLLVGAWVCWAVLTKYQVPFWVGMPITLVFMFLFGIAIQIVILRPMIGEPIISVIMVTIGLSTACRRVFRPAAARCFRRRSSAASTRSAAPFSAGSSSGFWKTSRNISTANICTGATSMRSRPSTCSSSS